MPQAMSSQKMFRVGLVLGILGALFYLVASPLLGWLINESNIYDPLRGFVGGLAAVLQQGAFYGGLFLLAGSFVVRSAEEAVAAVRKDKHAQPERPRD
ncbi:hypothetical protein ACIPVK_15030 [Paeniglutamicibacter sp. MACA_103]|uniref:hypothetical protein n=1 Tax=Paeniglutamicibacter sp. MACA_103 TaxID=3377337 RepID=UPI003893AA69